MADAARSQPIRASVDARRPPGGAIARGEEGQPGAAVLEEVAAKVGQGAGERAEVQRHVEGLGQTVVAVEVVPAEQPRHECEVARTRDRQELRESLRDAEDDGVEDGHDVKMMPLRSRRGSLRR